MKLGNNSRTALAVLVPEVTVAPVAALGAIYCAEKFTPHQLSWLQRIVSDHIVQPHLELFESLGGSLRRAREKHAEQRRAERAARGEMVSEKPEPPMSRTERADLIADVLTKGAIAFSADLVATRLGHHVMSRQRLMNVPVPKKTAFIESAIHLGGVALMAGPFARLGEDAHYSIKRKLRKWGWSNEKADDLGTIIPYIVFPGQIAAIGSLGYTLGRQNGWCR